MLDAYVQCEDGKGTENRNGEGTGRWKLSLVPRVAKEKMLYNTDLLISRHDDITITNNHKNIIVM